MWKEPRIAALTRHLQKRIVSRLGQFGLAALGRPDIGWLGVIVLVMVGVVVLRRLVAPFIMVIVRSFFTARFLDS